MYVLNVYLGNVFLIGILQTYFYDMAVILVILLIIFFTNNSKVFLLCYYLIVSNHKRFVIIFFQHNVLLSNLCMFWRTLVF